MKPSEKILKICSLLEEKKADDIIICDETKMLNVANWFVVCSSTNYTQTNAIADFLQDENQKQNLFEFSKREGFNPAKWVVIDFGEVIVHILTEEERNHYNLDKLFENGKNVESFDKLKKKLSK